ncbi:hypothetical protein CYMTET_23816 [Cymbomonas tetramitiformis]|uniref:Uncharacterized protein n=1 Tax=Cymbomonas tetramitiformis TaxID=36881 RepID=A0AAE0FXN1_9CHLO|nr:hypothetical protein CYMTET_23816 [Cymbomonas tetramitiformis]
MATQAGMPQSRPMAGVAEGGGLGNPGMTHGGLGGADDPMKVHGMVRQLRAASLAQTAAEEKLEKVAARNTELEAVHDESEALKMVWPVAFQLMRLAEAYTRLEGAQQEGGGKAERHKGPVPDLVRGATKRCFRAAAALGPDAGVTLGAAKPSNGSQADARQALLQGVKQAVSAVRGGHAGEDTAEERGRKAAEALFARAKEAEQGGHDRSGHDRSGHDRSNRSHSSRDRSRSHRVREDRKSSERNGNARGEGRDERRRHRSADRAERSQASEQARAQSAVPEEDPSYELDALHEKYEAMKRVLQDVHRERKQGGTAGGKAGEGGAGGNPRVSFTDAASALHDDPHSEAPSAWAAPNDHQASARLRPAIQSGTSAARQEAPARKKISFRNEIGTAFGASPLTRHSEALDDQAMDGDADMSLKAAAAAGSKAGVDEDPSAAPDSIDVRLQRLKQRREELAKQNSRVGTS